MSEYESLLQEFATSAQFSAVRWRLETTQDSLLGTILSVSTTPEKRLEYVIRYNELGRVLNDLESFARL